jgi:hypothetical protein
MVLRGRFPIARTASYHYRHATTRRSAMLQSLPNYINVRVGPAARTEAPLKAPPNLSKVLSPLRSNDLLGRA